MAMTVAGALRALFARNRPMDAEIREGFEIIRAATLTLLALIIGFTFSMALTRYDQRKNSEEAEADAIGTEYLHAGMLPEGDAARFARYCELTSNSVFGSTLSATPNNSARSRRRPRACKTSSGPPFARPRRRPSRYSPWLA